MADNHLAYDVYDEIKRSGVEPPSLKEIHRRVGSLDVRLRIIARMYRNRKSFRPGRDGPMRYV